MVSGNLAEAGEASEGIRNEYDALDIFLSELDRELQTAREEKNRSDMEQGTLEGRINVLKEQIRTEQMNAEHIEGRIQSVGAEIGLKKEQKAAFEQERSQIGAEVCLAAGDLKKAEEVLSKEDERIRLLEGQIEEDKAGIIGLLNEKASLNARLQHYETMSEQVNVRRSQVCQKLLKFKSDESEQEEQLILYEKEAAGIEEKLSRCLEGQEEAENQTRAYEGETGRLNKNVNNKQQEYHSASNRLESLKNIAERYEGYGGSIRKVMEAKDRIRGIHVVVADLLTVPKEYEVAVETALGGSIQNIVTDSEQTAKQLIEYLKKNRFGRATFLPLTSMGNKSSFHQENALSQPGVLGLANSLVETKPQYQGLLNQLLGRVVVADTIDHAIALAKKFQYSFRIVTLEGELLNPGGSMTGGAFKNTSNLLGRKREIEELEETCTKVLKEIDRLGQELSENEKFLAESREQVEQWKAQKQQLYLKQNTVSLNLRQTRDKKEEIRESYGDLERENGQLEQQIGEITKSRTGVLKAVEELEGRKGETEGRLEEQNSCLEESRAAREQYLKTLSNLQLNASGLKQKDDFQQENIKRIQEEISRLEEELGQLLQRTGGCGQAIEEKEQEIEGIVKKITISKERSSGLEVLIQEKTEEKEARAKAQKELFQKREELAGTVSLLDKELFRLQSQKEKLEERLENQVNYMWNEYQLTYTTAQELKNEALTSLTEVKSRIASLKEEIRKLGNVNVNAIEDYKEVSERYQFMKTQHDDLVTAEGTLLKIIGELDAGMRKQFEEKFREIRQEFDKVFKELFGGGRGTLELMEGEDILEAGVQIISQPPGKKLQNMMQLSGGEKALTAIALLFAIQNLKPSPFCLLDEIEAALDDSNVDRFAKYLHKLTKYTQFIVITHRRGTMVASDRLYGITMQEKGVSTLVCVNLIEEDLDQ